jgi:modification methylase
MLELNKIYQGDCLEVMKQIDDNSIDLVITSPPYNMKNCVGGFFKQEKVKHIWRDAKLRQGYDGYNDDMDYNDYVKWQRKVLKKCMRVLKEDGAIFYNHKFRIQKGLLLTRMDIIKGFPLRQIVIWDKIQSINFNYSHIPPCYEVIFILAKKNFRFNSKGGWTDVWRIPADKKNQHPAPFPLEIPKKIIEKTNSKIVLDPFIGSGTTAIACIKERRKFIGIELSPKYYEIANERIKKELNQKKLWQNQ